MAKKSTFNSVNFAIWMILVAIILIGLVLLYNKSCIFEKFEEAEKKKEKPKKEKEEEEEEPEPKKSNKELDSKEQSIFEKIVKNEVSSTDIEKLINAGVITQNMVEKFLSKLDSTEESKIEAFCDSGSSSFAVL